MKCKSKAAQVRIDPDRMKLANGVIADVMQKKGRKLSLALVANMAMGIGLPEVRRAFLGNEK